MSDARRYNEDEVAEILDRATARTANDPGSSVSKPGRGVSLSELQEIGSEVGITPDRIAAAALALETSPPAKISRPWFLGPQRSVERTFQIPRGLTDEEWGRVVADLRETFSAQGELESHGSLRTWRNGNLQFNVEPDETGYRVRMKTTKGDVTSHIVSGALLELMALSLGLLIRAGEVTGSGKVMFVSILAGACALAGLGMFGWVQTMLPRWVTLRTRQMEGLAERIPLLLKDGE